MKKLKKLLVTFVSTLCFASVSAQIGYQVSLLNSATGEPRANETVSVTVDITNSQNELIISTTQSATTNDFGILSLTIGNADTFKNVDWSKLPFFVSASVEGVMIGKSQILNVPVAEAAKTLTSDFTLDELCGKEWVIYDDGYEKNTMLFYRNGSCKLDDYFDGRHDSSETCTYKIEGNTIYIFRSSHYGETLRWWNKQLYWCG